MKYSTLIKNFDSKKHKRTIDEIKDADKGAVEPLFMKIARDILTKEGFKTITKGPSVYELKGVPFDFIAIKKGAIALIELKGSVNRFNYSSEVQFARLYQVVKELNKRKIKRRVSTFLLQINLDFNVYQILDSEFYSIIFKNINKDIVFKQGNKKLGYKTPILPIVDDIVKRMRRKGVKI